MQHAYTICDERCIVSAAGEGKIQFVGVEDIAIVIYNALIREKEWN